MSANTLLYHRRKSRGVCVRCEAPTDGLSVLCARHHLESKSLKKQKLPDDAPWAIAAAQEPPRPAYKSDTEPVMPPIPDKCPRCSGFVLTQYGETRCMNCAWYLQPIHPSEQHQYGAKLPVVVEVK